MTDERNLPGVEDDDPTAADEDLAVLVSEQEASDAADAEEAAAAAAADQAKPDAPATPDGTTETAPATPAAAAEQAPAAQPAPTDRMFNQADVERIIGERLSRDRKTAAVRQLEAIAGQPVEQLVGQYRELQVQQAQQQYAMSTEEAAAYVSSQEELRQLKAEQEDMKTQQAAMAQSMAYQQDKAKHMTNPLVRRYEADIDAFSASGTALPFDAAMAYIIGQKVLGGEVLESVRQAAQQQTLAQVNKRANLAPEGTASGAPQNAGLSPQQKVIARQLGLTPKEYSEELAQIQRRAKR